MRTSDAPLAVVAGVLRDAAGRILLAQRPPGRAHAGLWEYPGGKIEPGESAAEALARELHEELGLDIEPSDCRFVITLPFAYPARHIRLDVLEVEHHAGALHGREGQALRWCTSAEIAQLPMPDADWPVLSALAAPDTYPITPSPGIDIQTFLRGFDALVSMGHRRLQLRAPGCPTERWAKLASACARLARDAGADLLLNGDIELARKLGTGVHLRARQLQTLDRRPLESGRLVGASCHDADELERAEALGVDFAVLGPVQTTLSHPSATALGWEGFASARQKSRLPIYALGGLAPADRLTARQHGAQGIAGIRGFWPG